MLLLKCELAYSTPAFSQEILIGFKEIAHANSENVTEQIIRATFFSFFIFLKFKQGSQKQHDLPASDLPLPENVFRIPVKPEQI